MRYVSKASPNSGVPGRNARPWSVETTPTSKKKYFDEASGFLFLVFLQAESSQITSVSLRISKYSYTVVRLTCASLATLVKFTMVALHKAATLRKRLKAGMFRVAPSATISCCRYEPA